MLNMKIMTCHGTINYKILYEYILIKCINMRSIILAGDLNLARLFHLNQINFLFFQIYRFNMKLIFSKIWHYQFTSRTQVYF